MDTRLPVLNSFSPDTGESVASGSVTLSLGWSLPMLESEFSNAGRLAEIIDVTNDSTHSLLPLTYSSINSSTGTYDFTISSVPANATIRVFVKSGVKNALGRSSQYPYVWTFNTSGTTADTGLLSPDNYALLSAAPTFTWSSAGTGVSYQFELDTTLNFLSPIFTGTAAATSYSPAYSYTANTTYFWRIRAYSASVTGAWTEPRSFYYGDVVNYDEQSPIEALVFQPISDTFNGKSNLASWPTIRLNFSQALAGTASAYVGLYKEPVLARNDVDGEYDQASVAVSYSISGSSITLTPTSSISNNYKYTVRVLQDIASTQGNTLAEDIELTFTSRYDPYYCSVALIESKIGAESTRISRDLINFCIHLASLDANITYLSQLGTVDGLGIDGLDEDNMRAENLTGHIVVRWTAAKAVWYLLGMILTQEARFVGRSTSLGDYSERLSKEFLESIQELRKEALDEMDHWASILYSDYGFIATVKSFNWDPNMVQYDRYLGPQFWHPKRF